MFDRDQYTARKVDEILVELLEREAEREDALHNVAGQILRQSFAARSGDRGGINLAPLRPRRAEVNRGAR